MVNYVNALETASKFVITQIKNDDALLEKCRINVLSIAILTPQTREESDLTSKPLDTIDLKTLIASFELFERIAFIVHCRILDSNASVQSLRKNIVKCEGSEDKEKIISDFKIKLNALCPQKYRIIRLSPFEILTHFLNASFNRIERELKREKILCLVKEKDANIVIEITAIPAGKMTCFRQALK